jgi:hypothetical protein
MIRRPTLIEYMVRRSLLFFICMVFAASAAIEIVESSGQRLELNFSAGGIFQRTYTIAGQTFTDINFEGQNGTDAGMSGVVVPTQAVSIGVPPEGHLTVSYECLQTRTMTLDHAPPPSSTNSVGDAPLFADPWISQPQYRQYRGSRVAHFVIRPCRYDPETKSLLICTRGRILFGFPPAPTYTGVSGVRRSAYEEMLAGLIVNWDIARRWTTPSTGVAPAPAKRASLPVSGTLLTFTRGDGNAGINEGTTLENGMVRISGRELVATFGSQVGIDNIVLYASPKGALDSVVPAPADIPAGITEMPLLRFDLDRDGRIDEQDYLCAYVSATSDWEYDTTARDFLFRQNRFEGSRHYWLSSTGVGRSVARFQAPVESVIDTVTSFSNHLMFRHATQLQTGQEGGTRWSWEKLTRLVPRFQYNLGMVNLTPDSSGRLKLYSGARANDSIEYFMGTTPLAAAGNWRIVPTWSSQRFTMLFTDRSKEGQGFYEIEGFEVRASQNLDMQGLRRLEVFSSNLRKVVMYRIVNLPKEPCYLWRIPPNESAITLIDSIPPNSTSYAWTDTGGIGIRYYACAASTILPVDTLVQYRPVSGSEYVLRDLRSERNSADFLIVTHPDFLSEAVRLAKHKSANGRFVSPRVVLVDDIFREFAGGNRDPTAVRNFLAYALNRWSAGSNAVRPDYVLLMGNGHYDYKSYSTTRPSFIPPYEQGPGCWEDFFATLTPGENSSNYASTPEIFVGRMPCESPSTAAVMVDKIEDFEGPEADMGAWRNTVLLVADDDMQKGEHDRIMDIKPHYISTEEVEQVIAAQDRTVDIRKVYLFEYEWDAIYEKPAASQAIINAINGGLSFVNFIGHGSSNVWADEAIMRNETVDRLINAPRYPVVASYSCSVGRFDGPGEICLSAALVAAAHGGAIAAISGTRASDPVDNTDFAKQFYRYAFNRASAHTIGQALCLAKQDQADFNQKAYALLGDPSLRLLSPTDTVSLSIVDDATGRPLDTLSAMQVVRISGQVLRDGAVNTSFGAAACSAWVQVGLFNPRQDSVQRKDQGVNRTIRYNLPGRPVFTGTTAVHNGRFEQRVFLPRRLVFDQPGVTVTAYAWTLDSARRALRSFIGKGYRDSIVFSGTANDTVTDTAGPRIVARCLYDNPRWNGGASSTEGLVAMLPADVEITLFDDDGIDVVGSGPSEGLNLEVSGALSRRNINHKFVFAEGDFRTGSADYTLNREDLKAGTYTLRIRGQDLLGNISSLDVPLQVIDEQSFSLGTVFNYPNPFEMGATTRFFFTHSGAHAGNDDMPEFGAIKVMIKIYTLSGRLVRIIRNARNGQVWDGTDERGNTLSPNVYLYRITGDADLPLARSSSTSMVKKLVIYPPR